MTEQTRPLAEAGGTYHLSSAESTCEGVVTAVAEATGRDPAALDPIYGSVDPDALEALFSHDDADGNVRIRFDYAGFAVTVRSDGRILLRRPESSSV